MTGSEATDVRPPAQASPEDVLPWQPGDVVLSADQRLYIRAHGGRAGKGRWLWQEGADDVSTEGHGAPEGGPADDDVMCPVTLLIRGGRPLGGMTIDDRTIRGALVHDELSSPPAAGDDHLNQGALELEWGNPPFMYGIGVCPAWPTPLIRPYPYPDPCDADEELHGKPIAVPAGLLERYRATEREFLAVQAELRELASRHGELGPVAGGDSG